jgi:excinuclease ABC subunit B
VKSAWGPSGGFSIVIGSMPPFKLDSVYSPTADQPAAIDGIAEAVEAGQRGVTLLGATGTGKTMTMAATIERLQRPALVMAHNKTLAAQLCNEFRTYFPANAVEYFVSYYDYYQPEAYVPSKDLYIEKDSAINQEIDRLRHAATAALFARRDVVIVASVSAIFGLGSPETYNDNCQILLKGGEVDRDELLRKLVYLQYNRNDTALGRGTFRVRGDTLEVFPAYAETAFRAQLFGDEVERLQHFDPLTGELIVDDLEHVAIWPATHYNVKEGTMERAVEEIGRELNARCIELEAEGKLLESHRLRQRTQYDMEMLREVGFCSGIENYSRILDGRPPGARPYCLRTSSASSTSPTRRCRRSAACTRATARASPRSSTSASGCRARWTTARRPSRSSSRSPRRWSTCPRRRASTSASTPRAWSSRSSGRRGSWIRRSRCARRATRSTT